MQHLSKFAAGQSSDNPKAKYAFAAGVSVLALVIDRSLNGYLAHQVTPVLPGFAAVIAAAAWAGFGPGLLSTAIVTAWCAVLLRDEAHSVLGTALRCTIFAAEGILLSVGSGRLRMLSLRAQRSEERHRSLIETSNEGIWVVDDSGAITYANPRMGEILGLLAAEIVGRKAEDFFFPSDLPWERIRFQSRRPGQREQFDRRLRRKDGSEAWVLACSSPFPGRNREPDGVLAMMTDITERKRAEQALRRSEQRFRSLFENVLEGVYQSTPAGEIVAANPMLLNMLGLASESELSDVNIARDLYVDANVRRRLLERLEHEGSFRNVEYQLRRRDGKIITVRENARAIRDEDGRVAYYEGTLSDVTDLMHMESELLKTQNRGSLDAICGGIPNEFRNVLTVISGYSQLLLEDLPVSHPARQAALDIRKSADEASALASQLAAFSVRREHAVDVNRLLLLSQRGFEKVRITLSPWSLPVQAETEPIERIIGELLDGAHSASAQAVCTDREFVRGNPGARIGQYARIAARKRESEFPTGETCEDLLRCGGFALSLGGGNGDVENAVYLPIAPDASAFLSTRIAAPVPRETVLLVEEEPLIRELVRDLLEHHGYGVIPAACVEEAEHIERRGHRFDLSIVSLAPPQSGSRLAQRLRLARPGAKVLLIAAGLDDAGPVDGCLERPFSVESLQLEIRRILSASG